MAAMIRQRHAVPVIVLLLAACSAAADPDQVAPRVVEPRPLAAPAPRGSALLRQAVLAGHARARADVGLPALAWDDALAADAGDYAREMARTGRFRHAEQTGPTRQGENLFTGTRGAYRYDEMVRLWVDERRAFTNAATPNFSRTGRWQDVAHYSQIVWRATTHVGCATASSASEDYLVCRYSPPGNVVGVRPY